MELANRLLARLEGWRTFIFNGVMALCFMMAEMMSYFQIVEWREIVPPEYAPWVVVGVNVLNIVLRHITKTAAPTKAITQSLFGGGRS